MLQAHRGRQAERAEPAIRENGCHGTDHGWNSRNVEELAACAERAPSRLDPAGGDGSPGLEPDWAAPLAEEATT